LCIYFLLYDVSYIVIHFDLSVDTINSRNVFPKFWSPFLSEFSFRYYHWFICYIESYFSVLEITVWTTYPIFLIFDLQCPGSRCLRCGWSCSHKISQCYTISIIYWSNYRLSTICSYNPTKSIISLNVYWVLLTVNTLCSICKFYLYTTESNWCLKSSNTKILFCIRITNKI